MDKKNSANLKRDALHFWLTVAGVVFSSLGVCIGLWQILTP